MDASFDYKCLGVLEFSEMGPVYFEHVGKPGVDFLLAKSELFHQFSLKLNK